MRSILRSRQAHIHVIDFPQPSIAEDRKNVTLDVTVVSSERRRSKIDYACSPVLDPAGEENAASTGVDEGSDQLVVIDSGKEAASVVLAEKASRP